MKRTTLRDIARLAKVSHVTVSLALRKHPSIPAKTRERIEEIAREVGYYPDPALSALLVYRRHAKVSKYKPTIAWVNSFKHPEHMYSGEYLLYFQGAHDRCQELGYHLEEFRMVDIGMRYDRLSKILNTRNIQGVLFAPQQWNRAHIPRTSFDWEKFSCISFGFTLASPRLHVVTNAQFRSARLAVRKLRALGYRRIGYAAEGKFDERTDGNFYGGFLVEQSRFPVEDHVPPFIGDHKDALGDFRRWYEHYRPDALFDVTRCSLWALSPEERSRCGIAFHDIPDRPGEYAGIHQNGRTIGRTGIDEIIAMIYANDRGIPQIPRRTLIEGRWMEGASVQRVMYPKKV